MDQEAIEVLLRRNPEILMDRPAVENLLRAKQRGSIEKDVSRYLSS